VVAVAAMAGCGSGDSKVASTGATSSTTTAQAKADGPQGKLSRDEYRSVAAAYKLLAPLNGSKNPGRTLRVAKRACSKVTTQTELLAAVHAECVQTGRFLEKAVALVRRQAECTRAAQAGDTSCFADLYRSLGRSARVAAVRGAGTNAALRKRGIDGACAKAIGTDPKVLAAARDVHRAGLGAAHALEAKNQGALQRASSRFTAALDRMDRAESPARVDLRLLKSCV
jgi:hypothetical protein